MNINIMVPHWLSLISFMTRGHYYLDSWGTTLGTRLQWGSQGGGGCSSTPSCRCSINPQPKYLSEWIPLLPLNPLFVSALRAGSDRPTDRKKSKVQHVLNGDSIVYACTQNTLVNKWTQSKISSWARFISSSCPAGFEPTTPGLHGSKLNYSATWSSQHIEI